MQTIPEDEARRLIELGSRVAEDEGGLGIENCYPIFEKNEIIGYGFAYSLTTEQNFVKKMIKCFKTLLREEYPSSSHATASVERYKHLSGKYSKKKDCIKIKNRSYGRRMVVYIRPEKLPKPKTLTKEKAIEEAIKKGIESGIKSPLGLILPWENEIYHKKFKAYRVVDLTECEKFNVDIRLIKPNYFDVINAAINSGIILGKGSIEKREKRFAKSMRELLLERFKKISWDDIGGLEEIKTEVKFSILAPLLNQKLFEKLNIRVSNTLLVGPPGSGKSTILDATINYAKMHANIIPFRPEYIAAFIGRDEIGVHSLFEFCDNLTRETNQYTILAWDDIDDIGSRFNASRDKVVNAMLRLMGGMENYEFSILGSTNRPTELDPGFFRHGRFGKILYVGVLKKEEERRKVFEIYTKNFNLGKDVDLGTLARKTEYFTGCDIKGLCEQAAINAVRRITANRLKKIGDLDFKDIVIENSDFENVLRANGERIKKRNKMWESNFKEWVAEKHLTKELYIA